MKVFFLLAVLIIINSSLFAKDFLLKTDGSVADLSSGLVWQGSSAKVSTGFDAVEYCQRITPESSYGWRLPTGSELSTLEDKLQNVTPAAYWAFGDDALQEGLYCFGDGAFFLGESTHTDALVRCVSKDPLAPVVEALNVWVDAWQHGDIDNYLSSYVHAFQPRDDVKHRTWKEQRRVRLSSATELSIDIETEEINRIGSDLVEIVFLQDYRSRHYSDRVRKRLLLQQQQGRWLIAAEEQLSSLSTDNLSSAVIYYK